jgi:cytoskeletal protein CcmA (bactofilin family)
MADLHSDILEDEDFDTIFSSDIEFAGELVFEKSFLVRGKISGIVDARGVFLVDSGAQVDADIKADRVIIRGIVNGNIEASRRIEITSSGRLRGNIRSPEILMDAGCLFNGNCVMPEGGQ